MLRTLTTIALCLLIGTGCKKEPLQGETNTSVQRNMWFTNQMDRPMYLNIYKTEDDYKYSRNPLVATYMKPGDNYNWEINSLQNLFFVDWHTETYEYTNWGVVPPWIGNTMVQPPDTLGFDYYYDISTAPDTLKFTQEFIKLTSEGIFFFNEGTRQDFINGNEPETVWLCVDALDITTGKSAWKILAIYEQNRQVHLTKDMRFSYSYGNNNNKTIIEKGRYCINFHDQSQGNLPKGAYLFPEGNHIFDPKWMCYSKLPGQASPSTKDTMFLEDGNYYFVMVRQP